MTARSYNPADDVTGEPVKVTRVIPISDPAPDHIADLGEQWLHEETAREAQRRVEDLATVARIEIDLYHAEGTKYALCCGGDQERETRRVNMEAAGRRADLALILLRATTGVTR